MTTEAEAGAPSAPRGRPRTKKAEGLIRRNVLINPRDLERVRKIYGAKSDSDAIRQALDAVLIAEEVEQIAEQMRAFGGPEDVYRHGTGKPKLPVYPAPGDIGPEDQISIDGDDEVSA